MSYVLEAAEKEFERLESQSKQANYDYQVELNGFNLNSASEILDAGCGSGVLTRYLSEQYGNSKITGCDQSMDGLKLAKQAAERFSNIEFSLEKLENMSFVSSRFDATVCRYVLQHMSSTDRTSTLSELFRVLKPGGKVLLIDADGFLLNLFPLPPWVAQGFEKIGAFPGLDFFVGRKINNLLHQAGFESILTKVEAVLLTGDSLLVELNLMEKRLENALPFLTSLFESEALAKEFSSQYLRAMHQPDATSFYTKFIVQAVKPAPKLSLIRR